MTVPVEDLFLHLSLQGAEARRLFLARSIFDLFQGTIGYGPLRGFKLESESSWNSADLGSKIFGMYEQEVMELLLTQRGNHDICINIGAADGYYGVGLVSSNIFSRSICYELTEAGRQVIAKTAQLNQVTNKVEIRGQATRAFPEELQALGIALPQCLILADI